MTLKERFAAELKNATRNGHRGTAAVAVVLGSLGVTSANAALPDAISTQLATVQADGLAMADLVWPVVITLFGAVVLFKLFKRFASKI